MSQTYHAIKNDLATEQAYYSYSQLSKKYERYFDSGESCALIDIIVASDVHNKTLPSWAAMAIVRKLGELE